jgi:hypothetical protein
MAPPKATRMKAFRHFPPAPSFEPDRPAATTDILNDEAAPDAGVATGPPAPKG